MITGVLKTVLVSLLAVLIGAGHSVCASAIANVAPTSNHQMAGDFAKGEHADGRDRHGEHSSNIAQGAPCDSGRHDCAHCDKAQYYKAPLGSDFAGSQSSAPIGGLVFSITDVSGASAARTSASGRALHWRGPPIETPVTQKIRQQN